MSYIPSGGDKDRGPGILVAIWVALGVSGVVLLLRLLTLLRIQRRATLDDYLIIFAWISQVINNGLLTRAVHWGLGRHAFSLTPEQRMYAVKYEFLAAAWAVVAPALGRVSFAVFLLVFLTLLTTVRRIFIWALIALQVVANALAVVAMYAQCSPVERVWDRTVPGSCWSMRIRVDIAFVQGAVNSLTDLLLTVVAVTLFASVNVRMCAKISLSAIMLLSIVAMVASVIKTVESKNLENTGDSTYDTGPFIIWYTIENNIVIIAASAPKIRPLFVVLCGKREQSGDQGGFICDIRNDGSASSPPNGRERKPQGSMLSMFKSAWDSTASWIWSECRDSRYSSTELRLPSSRQQDQDRDGDQDQDENEAQSGWHTPHRGGRRSIYPRSTSFPPLKVATISLSPLTPTSSATEKQQHQPKKPKPTISFSHLRSRSTNSVNLRPGSSTTRVDREALLRALSGQPIAQTVISAGEPVAGLPLSMPSTPTRARTPQPQPQSGQASQSSGPGCGCGCAINDANIDDPGINTNSSSNRNAVGPFCIWCTREFSVQYEDEGEDESRRDRDRESVDGGGGDPGPTVPASPAEESGPAYDEAAADGDGLRLFDVGGILGGNTNNNPDHQTGCTVAAASASA